MFTGEALYTKSLLSKALQHLLKHTVEASYNSSLVRHHRLKVHCLILRFILSQCRSLATVDLLNTLITLTVDPLI